MTGGANVDCLRSDTRAAGAGSAAQVLGALAGLPSLTFIDFSGQRLYGPLPANVTFSNLKFMNLGYNMLQVCTPPSGSTTRQLVWLLPEVAPRGPHPHTMLLWAAQQRETIVKGTRQLEEAHSKAFRLHHCTGTQCCN